MNELKPNFTQIPNVILDKLMSNLTDAELRVLMYICRRTYGFHRKADKISYSQFEKGIEGLDTGCGLRLEAISKGLTGLEERGLIIKTPHRQSFTYELNEECQVFDYRSTTPSPTEDKPLRLPNIQNKEKESEIKYIYKKEFLIEIPEATLVDLTGKYMVTRAQVISKGDQLYNWIVANNKKYSNYLAVLRNAVSRDYGIRNTTSAASRL